MNTVQKLVIAAIVLPIGMCTAGAAIDSRSPSTILMKRSAPKPVESVTANGVEYSAPPAAMGFVVAIDTSTRKELWRKQVYKIVRQPGLEGDVQDVFITKLKLDGARLIVDDEQGRRFALDLSTREVTPITK